jgi:Ca2+-binding RTX toxin-like protein
MAWRGWDGIYTQRYDANNNSIGTPNSIPASGGDVEVIGLADGGWLITVSTYDTWSEYDYAETISTRFDASGQQVAVISSGERGDMQTTPAVTTSLPDGGWLVTWEAMDDDYTGIFSQRYNAQGVAQLLEVHGTDQDDVLSGQAPIALSGGAGNDIYIVETSAAIVREHAGGGVDAVYSYLSSYTLEKNVENGRILATGASAITGNELNNVLYAGTGESGYGYILNGGAGIDTASFAYSKIGVTAQINFPANMINPAYNSLNDMENLTGSDHNDFLSGDLGNNVINGGLGADKMTGGDGSDTYYVDNAGDTVVETGVGADIVYSYLSNYTLGSNVENGRILSTDIASIAGNSLNNVIYAGAGNNLLNGAGGVDTVSYAYATSAISTNLAITTAQSTGGSGLDTLISIENLSGSAYDDSLTGDTADNKLSGGAGNDILNGGAGADKLIGGDGSDIYYVDSTSDVVSETNADSTTGGSDTVYSRLNKYTLGTSIENGRITTSGTASLTGNSLNNILYAGSGNNILNGDSGSDTASYLYATSAVTISLASTVEQATGGSGSDTLSAIENLAGSSYNDKLTGNSAGNKLSGDLGNDVLNGGAGADKMIGGDGSDTYYADNAKDSVSETNSDASTGGTDTVYSYLSSYSLGANVENGRVLATSSANLSGNSLNNVLMAGSGNNVLNGGSGIDTASYAYASSAVSVSLSNASVQDTNGSGSDTLISIENLIGSKYNDSLTGTTSSNTLNGGDGNDRLIGGAGKDLLIGGAGNDTFVFSALSDTGLTSDSWDGIKDFLRGDKIDLSKLDADATVSGNSAFSQIIDSTTAFTTAGQLRLTDGVLYGNTDADADAEFAIQLVGVSSLSMADFIA